jgi:hypothetical protein
MAYPEDLLQFAQEMANLHDVTVVADAVDA